MSGLSRRQFLKRAGLVGAAFATPAVDLRPKQPAELEPTARAFTLTSVHAESDQSSRVIGRLAPDSIHSVTCYRDWYQVAGGFVPRTAMQPIVPYSYPDVADRPGFWAELIAPVTAIRKWCAARAPIVTRLGFGAVVYVMDRLVDGSGQVWYGLAAEPESALVGWSPALHFSSAPTVPLSDINGNRYLIKIDTHQSMLRVYDQGGLIADAEIFSPTMKPAKTTLQALQPGKGIDSHIPLGLPWLMQLGTGHRVNGAFWHNQFGSISEGNGLELLPVAARYLYGLLLNPVAVEIV